MQTRKRENLRSTSTRRKITNTEKSRSLSFKFDPNKSFKAGQKSLALLKQSKNKSNESKQGVKKYQNIFGSGGFNFIPVSDDSVSSENIKPSRKLHYTEMQFSDSDVRNEKERNDLYKEYQTNKKKIQELKVKENSLNDSSSIRLTNQGVLSEDLPQSYLKQKIQKQELRIKNYQSTPKNSKFKKLTQELGKLSNIKRRNITPSKSEFQENNALLKNFDFQINKDRTYSFNNDPGIRNLMKDLESSEDKQETSFQFQISIDSKSEEQNEEENRQFKYQIIGKQKNKDKISKNFTKKQQIKVQYPNKEEEQKENMEKQLQLKESQKVKQRKKPLKKQRKQKRSTSKKSDQTYSNKRKKQKEKRKSATAMSEEDFPSNQYEIEESIPEIQSQNKSSKSKQIKKIKKPKQKRRKRKSVKKKKVIRMNNNLMQKKQKKRIYNLKPQKKTYGTGTHKYPRRTRILRKMNYRYWEDQIFYNKDDQILKIETAKRLSDISDFDQSLIIQDTSKETIKSKNSNKRKKPVSSQESEAEDKQEKIKRPKRQRKKTTKRKSNIKYRKGKKVYKISGENNRFINKLILLPGQEFKCKSIKLKRFLIQESEDQLTVCQIKKEEKQYDEGDCFEVMPKDKPIIKNLSKIMTAKIIYVTYKGKNNVEKLDEFEYVYKDY